MWRKRQPKPVEVGPTPEWEVSRKESCLVRHNVTPSKDLQNRCYNCSRPRLKQRERRADDCGRIIGTTSFKTESRLRVAKKRGLSDASTRVKVLCQKTRMGTSFQIDGHENE